jgi:hypothetical protein
MKPRVALACVVLGGLAPIAARAQEFRDAVDQALTFASGDQQWRAHLSGTLDVAGYHQSAPVSDLLFSDDKNLIAPRLTLYLDAQLGAATYFFAQARADRGFDPGDGGLAVRLDEYALRRTIWTAGRMSLQVGKFATVIGNWTARHAAWDNPLVSAPLPYDNLTGIWDVFPAPSKDALLTWAHVRPASAAADVYADKYRRLPIIWGPAYTTGAALAGAWDRLEYAVEFKNAAVAAQPEYWDLGTDGWKRPSFSGRLGLRWNELWNFGVSASEGEYLAPDALAFLPAGTSSRDYRETLFGQDVSFAWHHFQAWAEIYEAQFHNPVIGAVGTVAGYVEAKYKFTPRFAGAMRWNRQHFDDITASDGQAFGWSRQVSRLDLGVTFRLSPDAEVKIQTSFRHENPAPQANTQEVDWQWVWRF